MRYADAVSALETLYAALPSMACPGRCEQSCGVIVMTRLEWIRIRRKLGYAPKGKPSLVCPLLKKGRCSVYALRPLICRLYGMLQDQKMRCGYGCAAERFLTEEESNALLTEVEHISAALFPNHAPAAFAQKLTLAEISEAFARHSQEDTPHAP